jgi:Protein of unknown function (DUF2917)
MILLYPMTQKGAAMNTQPMSNLHRSLLTPQALEPTPTPTPTPTPSPKPWAWRLLPHQARSLPGATCKRWLLVNRGTVWITQAQHTRGAAPPEDIWLQAGDSLALPAGSSWVVEAGAEAELSLAEPAPALAQIKRGWRGFSWASMA